MRIHSEGCAMFHHLLGAERPESLISSLFAIGAPALIAFLVLFL